MGRVLTVVRKKLPAVTYTPGSNITYSVSESKLKLRHYYFSLSSLRSLATPCMQRVVSDSGQNLRSQKTIMCIRSIRMCGSYTMFLVIPLYRDPGVICFSKLSELLLITCPKYVNFLAYGLVITRYRTARMVSAQCELIPLQTVRYRSNTTLSLPRLHRRLLHDARLQPKTVKN